MYLIEGSRVGNRFDWLMGAGRARGMWGRVQSSPGISCGSRVQSRVVGPAAATCISRAYRDRMFAKCGKRVAGSDQSLCYNARLTRMPGGVCLDLLERVTARPYGMEKTMPSAYRHLVVQACPKSRLRTEVNGAGMAV